MEADREGHRFVVVEQERRHTLAGLQPVATRRAVFGQDRVAERPQAIDVAAEGADGDLEAVGQLGTGPVAAPLEERQEAQGPRRGVGHDRQYSLPKRTGTDRMERDAHPT